MPGFTPGRRWQPRITRLKKNPFGRWRWQCGIHHQKPALRLPHVRKLPCYRKRFHLPDGMSKG